MKKFEINIPENTYVLSDAEISLIHAMSFYFASTDRESNGMTKKAQQLVEKMEKQFRLHDSIGNFAIWE